MRIFIKTSLRVIINLFDFRWALGVLIYEMLVGYPPFYDKNPFQIYEKIIDGRVNYPKDFNPLAKDLIRKLLCVDRTKRFGNMKNGANDIKNHEWFKKVNWKYVEEKKLKVYLIIHNYC